MKSFASTKPSRSRRRRASLALTMTTACIILLLSGLLKAHAQTGGPQTPEEFRATTVFLVRHAEKADSPAQDPALSDAGKARARELARMLGGANVKAIYTSQYLRTKETAAMLAAQLGLTPTVVTLKSKPTNPREVSEQSIAEIVNQIHARAGETALVIGHSNSVPDVIRMLGGDIVPKIDEKIFDDLFVLTIYAKGKAKVAAIKYGNAN